MVLPVEVVSYAGSRSEERPRSFVLFQRRINIKEILGMWQEEDKSSFIRKNYFKIKAEDEKIYTLFYNQSNDTWYVIL